MSRVTYDRQVWEIVWQIPPGRVLTYGQIGAMIPPPEGIDIPSYERIAPRWVGYAMRRCMNDDTARPPDADQPSIPWHRVINSQGKISLPVGSADAAQQQIRLEAEGIELDRQGRVNFQRYGWAGPDDDWLNARGLLRPHAMVQPSDTD
ncbi:MAG: MGMT family protein [Anaerolineae bacterium]|nr:MGMT family protein [Anaerolineae bacterium]